MKEVDVLSLLKQCDFPHLVRLQKEKKDTHSLFLLQDSLIWLRFVPLLLGSTDDVSLQGSSGE